MTVLQHLGEKRSAGAGVALLVLAALLASSAPLHAGIEPVSDNPGSPARRPPPVADFEGGERLSPADVQGRYVYLIEFREPGALHRESRAPGERFDATSSRAQADLDQIRAEQVAHLDAISAAIGFTPEVSHFFLVTHSGVAARLTPQEAAVVRELRGVVSVERERLYELDTYRGPSFIGADQIWDGSAVPGGVGTEGEGMIIGMLDGGVASTHPSFANDPDCPHGGGNPDKLITFLDCATTDLMGLCNGPAPEDTGGHGTHTASTAGGNTLDGTAMPPPFTTISGVAPCAHIRAYKVCPTTSCPGANIQAGMTSILLHGDVDVVNFSISGGTSPWVDNDRRKLDLVDAGVFVAASAGNTSAGVPNPVGNVNHRGPWVLSVAASTHDGTSGLISADGPGSPPAGTQNISATRGSDSLVAMATAGHLLRHYTMQDPTQEGCTPGEDGVPAGANAFPAGFFTGGGALVHRGTCSFTKKITNAFNAGADWVVIRNNQAGTIAMTTTLQPAVAAYSIDQTPGNALVAFVDANPGTSTFAFVPKGDTLAGFSLRGPTPAPLADLQKPDITGPGVSIYAAQPTVVVAGGYGNLSGTSMSSPHAAGAATLIRDVHPTWTPPEVKSAMMMTAFVDGDKENGTTPWDADDVGSGRIDLPGAVNAGLVMHETTANYLAADPAMAGDVKTLNIPAVRDVTCTPNCTWTRTVRNTLAVPTDWTSAGQSGNPDLDIDVAPAHFSFTGGLAETQVLTITAFPRADLSAAVAFGEVVLSEDASLSPDLRVTVAIQGMEVEAIFADAFESGDTSAWDITSP